MLSNSTFFPYFRGKQFELIALREKAKLIADAKFTPILEPIKENLTSIIKTLSVLTEAGSQVIVIANPLVGDLVDDFGSLVKKIKKEFANSGNVIFGISLTAKNNIRDYQSIRTLIGNGWKIALIHNSFTNGKELEALTKDDTQIEYNIFLDDNALYRRRFKKNQILIFDGFQKRKNRDYPFTEFFSDTHITYAERGFKGFGDYSVVGEEYSETGGPAYAVAIHLTYIDNENDDVMNIYHFVSDTTDTPTDPAGKFLEAINKFKKELGSAGSHFFMSDALKEFVKLADEKHFPGLGYVKKLSMEHHLELIADFQRNNT